MSIVEKKFIPEMGLGFSVSLRIRLSRSMMVEAGQRNTKGNLIISTTPFCTESMVEVTTIDMIGIKPKLFIRVVRFPTTGGPLSDHRWSTFRPQQNRGVHFPSKTCCS